MKKTTIDTKSDLFSICYDICVSSNWNNEQLLSIVNDIGLNPDTIKANAVNYMMNYLKMSKEEINKHYKFLIPKKIAKLLHDFDKLISYLIRNSVITTDNISDYFWLSNNLEITLLKASYNICESVNWKDNLILEKAKDFNINSKTLLEMGIKYRKVFFKENDKKIEEYISKRKKRKVIATNNDNNLFDQLIKAESHEQIIKIFSKFDALEINEKILLLGKIVERDDYDKFESDIMRKLDIYLNHKKMKGVDVKEEIIDIILKAKSVISKFISYDNSNVEEFCKTEDITLQQFGDYLSLVKSNDINLFNEYLKKINAVGRKR